MEMLSLARELKGNSYPGRGIVIGKTSDGTKAVAVYFIMGRSENSRNRIFVEDGEGIRTQAFDESKLTDPSLICSALDPILHLPLVEHAATAVDHHAVRRKIHRKFRSAGIGKLQLFPRIFGYPGGQLHSPDISTLAVMGAAL